MVDWDDKHVQEWKKFATDEQTKFLRTLGSRKWEKYTRTQIIYLKMKIGYALYGPPKDVDDSDKLKLYYPEDQKKQIRLLFQEIMKFFENDDNIHIAFLILNIKHDSDEHHYQLPVIRVRNFAKDGFSHFVDYLGRVYNGWQHFLDTNKIPKGFFCYPSRGFYKEDADGSPDIEFATPPASDTTHKLYDVADKAAVVGTVIAIAATVVSVLAPVTAPILAPLATYAGAAAGGYGVVRGTGELVDRAEHDQSISLSDPEARADWFSIVGGLFGVSSIGVLRYTQFVAESGELASDALIISYSILETGTLTVNGMDIIFQVSHFIDRDRKEELTSTDLFRFLISTFFFTHSLMTFKSAKTIIIETQNNIIDNYTETLPAEHQKAFTKLLENARQVGTPEENSTIVRGIKRINNTNDFFHKLILANAEGVETGSSIVFTETGLIKINNELVIHPLKLSEIADEARGKIFNFTKRLQQEPEYAVEFQNDIELICRKERIRFESQRKSVLSKMSEKLEVDNLNDFELNGKKIFKNIQPFQIDRLDNVMRISCDGYDKQLMKIVQEFAAANECANVTDFNSFAEYAHKFILDNRGPLTKLLKNKKQTFQAVVDELKDPKGAKMTALNAQYRNMKQDVSQANATGVPNFANDNAATYHFYKHGYFDREELSVKKYFQMMRTLFRIPEKVVDTTLSQEGDAKFITFEDSSMGANGVLIERAVSNQDYTLFACTFFYEPRIAKRAAAAAAKQLN